MTTPSDGDRALLIKKLLNKAEAKGVTDAERDAFNAKATALMIQWGIDEAIIQNADRAKIENIVQRHFETDAPKVYSYEYTTIGIQVANQFGCRGLLQKTRDGRTNLLVVGFESDVERVQQLFASLTLQCTLALAAWYAAQDWYWANGTDKFNGKRSFIQGFARGVRTKLESVRKQVVDDAAPGTDLVLVDRKSQVDKYVNTEMHTGVSRVRRYTPNGSAAGAAAGRDANIGGAAVGGSRRAVNR